MLYHALLVLRDSTLQYLQKHAQTAPRDSILLVNKHVRSFWHRFHVKMMVVFGMVLLVLLLLALRATPDSTLHSGILHALFAPQVLKQIQGLVLVLYHALLVLRDSTLQYLQKHAQTAPRDSILLVNKHVRSFWHRFHVKMMVVFGMVLLVLLLLALRATPDSTLHSGILHALFAPQVLKQIQGIVLVLYHALVVLRDSTQQMV